MTVKQIMKILEKVKNKDAEVTLYDYEWDKHTDINSIDIMPAFFQNESVEITHNKED